MPQLPHRPTQTRPKHQQLVLKCYPRLPKNATADVKPNNSELSYLLYYCSTRQHKLPKVGHFLEARTASDVWRWQSARVHVTLQILTAILEHNTINRASGFALIAPSVLHIIREIVNNTNDISLIEATLAVWAVFCEHQPAASLAADSEYRALYMDIVNLYASLAKNNPKKLGKSTQTVANHDALRLRKVGVAAITAIFAPSEQVDRSWHRAFDTAFASVLTNIRNVEKRDYIDYLEKMYRNPGNDEEVRVSSTLNRRQSISTVRTFSGLPDDIETDPRTAKGTAQDADRLEEEEVGLLAVDCIKSIFDSQNRAQVRAATVAFMRYIAEDESFKVGRADKKGLGKWATQLFRLMTKWTPVQDRFVVVFTAQEMLSRLPIEGSAFHPHETYAVMLHGVICSDLNLIGLSVMDVLVGLMAITIKAVAYASRSDSLSREMTSTSTLGTEDDAGLVTVDQLKGCIACLASHVYYSDQVTDMIAAILMRIRAYPTAADMKKDIFGEARSGSNPKSADATISPPHIGQTQQPDDTVDPKTSASDIAASTANGGPSQTESASESVRPETSDRAQSLRTGYFISDEARRSALEIIKNIIETAQSKRKQSHGSMVITRNRVPVGVWEGTQWLARDPSDKIRAAYKAAVTTWALYESDEKDTTILDFESEDCFGKFGDKSKPASVRGSIGQSHHSHPQLLLLPNFGVERRLSSGKNSSIGTDHPRPRVRAKDLEDIMDGKRHVEVQVGVGGNVETKDLRKLLANIQVDESKRRIPIMAAPPY